MKTSYRIDLSYPYHLDLDEKLYAKFGYSDGSGAGFGERDHSWYFTTEKKAKTAMSKMKEIHKAIKVSMTRERA